MKRTEHLLYWLFLGTFVVAFGLPFLASAIFTKDLPDPDFIIPDTGGNPPSPIPSTETVKTLDDLVALPNTATDTVTVASPTSSTSTLTSVPAATESPMATRTPFIIEPTLTRRPRDSQAQPLPTIAPTQPPPTEPLATEPPPTEPPTVEPTDAPTEEPTAEPTDAPTEEPTVDPTEPPPATEPPAPEPPVATEPPAL